MPIHDGHDATGSYIQWGGHGAKYYYGSRTGVSREEATHKAARQAAAAHAHGYRGD